MTRKTPSILNLVPPPLRTVPLAQRWTLGWDELVKDSATLGFEPWVPRYSRLFTDWNLDNFAIGPSSVDGPPDQAAARFVYCGAAKRLTEVELAALCSAHSLVILDSRHVLAPALKNAACGTMSAPPGLVIVNAADAFADWLVYETWIEEWVADATEDEAPCAEISPRARLEPGVLIGPNSLIEDDVVLSSGVRIGANVRIGAGSRVGPYSVIADGVRIGQQVQIGPHCAVGTPGFGMVVYPNVKAPRQRMHAGSVVIGDRVRLGAFVSIDRGVFSDTMVGADTQIDNHVQIAHNCELGEANVLCAFVGLAGSTKVGARSTFAGMVGTKGHTKVGDDVIIGAQSGVSRDLRDGEQVKGYPPRPMAQALKIATLTSKLPEIYTRLKAVEKLLKNKDDS